MNMHDDVPASAQQPSQEDLLRSAVTSWVPSATRLRSSLTNRKRVAIVLLAIACFVALVLALVLALEFLVPTYPELPGLT